jgi:endoglucanase
VSTPTPAPAAAAATSLGFAPAAAAKPSTGISLPLGKCINVDGDLDMPLGGNSDWPTITNADFARIKAAGFVSIRLPVRWAVHAGSTAPYTIDPKFIASVKTQIDQARANGLNVLVDLHYFDQAATDPVGQTPRLTALWKQIGTALASYPSANVWFELMNEPNTITPDQLAALLKPALAAVRATNPTRPVIIGGTKWSEVEALDTLILPDDPYVVPEFHFYNPMQFTHQGAPWVAGVQATGITFGSANDVAQLNWYVKQVKAYMTKTGRVPILGEYGAIVLASAGDRAKFIGSTSAAFASIGVQSCVWDYGGRWFNLWNGTGWRGQEFGAIQTTVKQ